MAVIALTATDITRDGIAEPAEQVVNTADTYEVPNDGRIFIVARNSAATTTRNVTVQTPGTVDGLAVGDRVVAVPVSVSRLIGPFPPAHYNDPVTNVIRITGDHADLRLRVYRLP